MLWIVVALAAMTCEAPAAIAAPGDSFTGASYNGPPNSAGPFVFTGTWAGTSSERFQAFQPVAGQNVISGNFASGASGTTTPNGNGAGSFEFNFNPFVMPGTTYSLNVTLSGVLPCGTPLSTAVNSTNDPGQYTIFSIPYAGTCAPPPPPPPPSVPSFENENYVTLYTALSLNYRFLATASVHTYEEVEDQPNPRIRRPKAKPVVMQELDGDVNNPPPGPLGVDVAVDPPVAGAQSSAHRCRWLLNHLAKFRKQSCDNPIWLPAIVHGNKWRFRIDRPLAPGRYIFYLRTSSQRGSKIVFDAAHGNRLVVTVSRRGTLAQARRGATLSRP